MFSSDGANMYQYSNRNNMNMNGNMMPMMDKMRNMQSNMQSSSNNPMNKCVMKDAYGSKGQDYAAYDTFTASNIDVRITYSLLTNAM